MNIKKTELANKIKSLDKNADITITGGNWTEKDYEDVKKALKNRENEGCNFTFRFSDELTRWDFKQKTLVSSCVKAVYFPVSLIETDLHNWGRYKIFEDSNNTTDFYFPEFWKTTCGFSKCENKRVKFYSTDKKQFGPGKYEFGFSTHCYYLQITAMTKDQAIQNLIEDPDEFPFNDYFMENKDINKVFSFWGFDKSSYDPLYFQIGKYTDDNDSESHSTDYFFGTIYDIKSTARSLDENSEETDYYMTFGEPVINTEYDFENLNLEYPYYIWVDPQKHHVESYVLDAKEGFNLSDIHFNLVSKDFKNKGWPKHEYTLINSIYYKDEPLSQNICDDVGSDCMELYRVEESRTYSLDWGDDEIKKLKKIIREREKQGRIEANGTSILKEIKDLDISQIINYQSTLSKNTAPGIVKHDGSFYFVTRNTQEPFNWRGIDFTDKENIYVLTKAGKEKKDVTLSVREIVTVNKDGIEQVSDLFNRLIHNGLDDSKILELMNKVSDFQKENPDGKKKAKEKLSLGLCIFSLADDNCKILPVVLKTGRKKDNYYRFSLVIDRSRKITSDQKFFDV